MNSVDRLYGSFFGMTIGDALGGPLEFRKRGSFPHTTEMEANRNFKVFLQPGSWTDDSSLALCLAASLAEKGDHDGCDQLTKYGKWLNEGYMSVVDGQCFDVGKTIFHAICAFELTGLPEYSFVAENTCGNGSLMRLAPVPMFAFVRGHTVEQLLIAAAASSKTTHGHVRCVDSCRLYALMIWAALGGCSKTEIFAVSTRYATELGELHPEVAAIAESCGSLATKSMDKIESSGYVIHSLEAALWAFATTDTFEAGCIAAVNLGEDADTVGAIYGMLAGAYYGFKAIPERWLATLQKKRLIATTVRSLINIAEN